jgi:6-pyruvoyltetrahydropterin/6-carboxytetrahydropterin synthase
VEIYQEFTFDAAHHFPGAPAGHPYQGLHGHSFTARVVLRGPMDAKTGFIADLGDVEARCGRLKLILDHKYLNEIEGLKNPSLEHIAMWIWNELKADLPSLAKVEVRRDSCRHGCTYEGGG